MSEILKAKRPLPRTFSTDNLPRDLEGGAVLRVAPSGVKVVILDGNGEASKFNGMLPLGQAEKNGQVRRVVVTLGVGFSEDVGVRSSILPDTGLPGDVID